MSSPQGNPRPAHGAPPSGPIWVNVEFVIEDDDGNATHYQVEGHPGADFDPEKFRVIPEFQGSSPLSHLEAIAILIDLRLDDVAISVTNEPEADTRRRSGLRLVD